MNCCVFSPCGRYRVRLASDGKQRLSVDVRCVALSSLPRQSSALAQPHLTATLNEAQVLELTAAAGVRKSFTSFSEMMFNALIGRAACVSFHVESCAEMKQRITADVARRRRGGREFEAPSRAGEPSHAVAALDRAAAQRSSTTADVTIDLSISSDMADEVLAQRFLTIDYDVDFTRAIFPIPLEAVTGGSADLPGELGTVAPDHSGAVCEGAARRLEDGASAAVPTADGAIEQLQRENAKLKDENAALVQLSREKLLEMQRLCSDFQGAAQATADAQRLRAQNADLRVQLREAKEALEATRRSLEAQQLAARRGSQRQPLSSRCSSVPSSGAQSRTSSPNPYMRSLSRASAGSHSRDQASAPPQRGRASARGSIGSSRARSRPLLSPTPPPRERSARRSTARGWFDTPPPAERPRRRDGGGDSPAPRGRSGNRALGPTDAEGSDGSDGSRALAKTGGWPGQRQRRGGMAGGVGSRHSSVARSEDSRASLDSHTRLYRASTASSRSRESGVAVAAALLDTPPRRAVFH